MTFRFTTFFRHTPPVVAPLVLAVSVASSAWCDTDLPVATPLEGNHTSGGATLFCKEKVFFDGKCRGAGFFAKMIPDGEALVAVIGKTRGAKAEPGSAVLLTSDNPWQIRAYHLSGEPASRLSKPANVAARQDLVLEGLKGRGREKQTAVTMPEGVQQSKPRPYGGYLLNSRVTSVRGQTGGYSSIYTEIATPQSRNDLTLYASTLQKWGPSRSFDTITCRSQRNLDDIGSTQEPGCSTVLTTPSGSGSSPNIRQQCMASEEVASELVDWAVTSTCGWAGMGLVHKAAGEGSAAVFAGVAVETGNPVTGGIAAGGTYVVLTSAGGVVVGTACSAAGEAMDELIDDLTGCNRSGLPTDADDWTDVYDTMYMLNDAGKEFFGEPGSCLVCKSSEVETVGGGWNEQEGTMEVIGEVVCNDWEWVSGTDVTGDGFCD